MRILIFNWKDIRNPIAGGAEVFTHEVAKRWVAWGHEVALFCARFPGAPEAETIDGVRVIRRGGRLGVYREAPRFWRSEGAGNFDVVIDEVNTRPFLTPRFVRDTPIVCLIHQLAAEVWHEEVPPIISHIGRYWLEPRWLRLYRRIPTVTVSASTESDLRRLGFENVTVVPEGLSVTPLTEVPEKEPVPTLIFVGRLVKTKRPDHALLAHALLREQIPDAQLWVVGGGYMRKKLERMAAPGVTFFGYVDEEEKHRLMARAHVLVVPGVREGWGLVVIEANAMGTPALAYRIPGLIDAVPDERTGLHVEAMPAAMAAAAVDVLSDPARYAILQSEALRWAPIFDWERTMLAASEVVEATTGARAKGSGNSKEWG